MRGDSAPSASADPRAVAPGCSRPPVAPQGALRCESGAPAARGLKPRRGALLAPIRTSRPVGGVYGRSGLRPGTETGGASAEARVKSALGPRLKPGRPPTVFMRRRIKAGYLAFRGEERASDPLGQALRGTIPGVAWLSSRPRTPVGCWPPAFSDNGHSSQRRFRFGYSPDPS